MSLADWSGLNEATLPIPPVSQVTKSADVRVFLPPLEELVKRWNEIGGMLEKATSRTCCYEPVDLLMMAGTGQVGIWLCMQGEEILAALVSQVTVYPRRKILEMLFAGGGNMRAWRDAAVQALDKHAKQLGCTHVACAGRPGWARAWGGSATGDIIMVREI